MARLSAWVTLAGLLAQQTAASVVRNGVELPACANHFSPFEATGCYQDYDGKTLDFRSTVSSKGMTAYKCQAICKGNGYQFSGLKYYGICFCGSKLEGPKLPDSNCTLPCDGDQKESCGGTDSLTVYRDPTFLKLGDAVDDDDYDDTGCFTDDSAVGRTLGFRANIDAAKVTPATCIKACLDRGLPFAGAEFGGECWCGALVSPFAKEVNDTDCNMPCGGDQSLDCGGRNRINIFRASELLSQDPCENDNEAPPRSPSPTQTTTKPTDKPTDKSPATTRTPTPTTPATGTATGTATATSTKICTTVVPKDEWCVGKWCNEPLPDFSNEKTCFASWAKCHLQTHACLKFAGWPAALECANYKQWCKDAKLFCRRSCTSKSRNCSKAGHHAENPPRGGDNKDPVTKTVPCDEATGTMTPGTIPEPTNLCVQPHNPGRGYTIEDPVGDIDLPVVTCNNNEADHKRGNPFKQYDHSNWGHCPSYKRGDVPKACKDACKQQYERCRGVYAKSRDTRKDRKDDDDDDDDKKHKHKGKHEDKEHGDRKHGGKKGKKHERRSTGGGGELSAGTIAHPKDEYHTALRQCKDQYEDCRKVNADIKGDDKCARFGGPW
ncbi:putative fungistatic metabolite like protein [Verticillium longisporum]|nr:putative fungistatic metabolite like protein [Verticillium longisporum]